MKAMMDARCSKCHKHIGWYGTMSDMPACSRCGHRAKQESLDHDAKELQEVRELLSASSKKRSAQELYRQRRLSGLTLHQAAKQLSLEPVILNAIEQGLMEPLEDLRYRMAKCYGIPVSPRIRPAALVLPVQRRMFKSE